MQKAAHIQSFRSFCAKLTYPQKDFVWCRLVWNGRAFWAEKRELGLWHFKSKKQNNNTSQCQNHFLTSDEMASNIFFGLSLVSIHRQQYIDQALTKIHGQMIPNGVARNFFMIIPLIFYIDVYLCTFLSFCRKYFHMISALEFMTEPCLPPCYSTDIKIRWITYLSLVLTTVK